MVRLPDVNLNERELYCLTHVVAAATAKNSEISPDTIIASGDSSFDAIAKDASKFGFIEVADGGYVLSKLCLDIVRDIIAERYETSQQSAYIGAWNKRPH